MLTRLYGESVGGIDLVPHAVLKVSVAGLRDRLGTDFETGTDDLDNYDAAFFTTGSTVFALIHHHGEPPDTVNIYLSRSLSLREAEKLIHKVMKKLEISDDLLIWREGDVMHRVVA